MTILSHLEFQEPKKEKRPSRFHRPTISDRLREHVVARDHGCCVLCFSSEDIHIDHVYAVSGGGPTIKSNLVVMCRQCNMTKRTRLPLPLMIALYFYLDQLGEDLDWTQTFYPLNQYHLTEAFDVMRKGLT